MSDEKQLPVICRIFGHKWEIKIRREDEPKGYTTIHLVQRKACIRCGCLNPNYGQPEDPCLQP